MAKQADIEQLQQFMNRLSGIIRDCFGSYGRNLSFVGMSSSAGVLGQQLQRAANDFANGYVHDEEEATLELLAKKVEGCLMAGQTMSAITQKEADELTDQLYNLIGK